MATQRQIDANRRNALKSTGPRTPEGKAAVRLNSLRHGLRARTVVLPGEDSQEFRQLCEDLEAEWQPQTRTEQFYLEQMAVAQWKLTRLEVGEMDLFCAVGNAEKQIPLLDRLWNAQHRLERSYARAQQQLEHIQNARLAQADSTLEPSRPAPQPSSVSAPPLDRDTVLPVAPAACQEPPSSPELPRITTLRAVASSPYLPADGPSTLPPTQTTAVSTVTNL